MYKESIQEPHHKHGMHSCLNRKFLLSTFTIDVQPPFLHKHHLAQGIVFLQEHEQHKEHHGVICLLLLKQVSSIHEEELKQFDLNLDSL